MFKKSSNLGSGPSNQAFSMPRFSVLFLPILIEQLFSMLLGNVDVLMLSQYSDDAVAAVGLSNQIIAVGIMILGIVSLGSSIQLMQIIGSNKETYIKSIIRNSVYLNVLVSICLAILFLLLGRTFLRWIQTPSELIEGAYLYLVIVGISLIFQSVMTSFSTIFRSFTFVKVVMLISILTNILNIIGNYIVILTPWDFLGTGIEGVARSTLIARSIGSLLIVIAFIKLLPNYKQSFKTLKVDKESISSIFKLGFPSALENISYTTSQMMITGIIASFGTVMVTSKIYTQNITAVIFTVAASVSIVNQIIVGRYIGMNLKKEAKFYTNKLLARSVGTALLSSFILALLSSFIIKIFTDDPAIQHTVLTLVWISILLEPARMVNEIIIGALNTAGDVKYPTTISILVTYIFTVPMSYIVGIYLGYGLTGVWIVFIVDEWIKAAILYKRWTNESWRDIQIFEKENLEMETRG